MHGVAAEAAVVQRAGGIADLGKVPLGERVRVHDDGAAVRQVRQVGLQSRRVHRDEDVGGVARGEHVMIGELHLEARHPGEGPGGGADLCGKAGQRREVVAQRRGLGGEPVTGQLHPVAGVAGEADDDSAHRRGRSTHRRGRRACRGRWTDGGAGRGHAVRDLRVEGLHRRSVCGSFRTHGPCRAGDRSGTRSDPDASRVGDASSVGGALGHGGHGAFLTRR